MILGVETSCDDTCAAVLDERGRIRSSIRSSQDELHGRFGGVVPEVASRRHLDLVIPVIEEALARAGSTLDDVESVAVTQGPGLIGALLVGLAAAKAVAYARGVPLVPVDHLQGHVAALSLLDDPPEPPFVCLLASGGHTLLLEVPAWGELRLLGGTLDDAAGEAFDKGARLLGLPYPGGPALEGLARDGDPAAIPFPRAMAGRPGCDLSFSGLKTALAQHLQSASPRGPADVAASYQQAIVDTLLERTLAALAGSGLLTLAVVGGVAANGRLRGAFEEACAARGIGLHLAPLSLCADNAAMIAAASRFAEQLPPSRYLGLDAYARSPLLSLHATAAKP